MLLFSIFVWFIMLYLTSLYVFHIQTKTLFLSIKREHFFYIFSFHSHTLELYCAVCSHGNHRVAHELTKHVDEMQMMFTILSECMYDI